jgi:hypothetical protein
MPGSPATSATASLVWCNALAVIGGFPPQAIQQVRETVHRSPAIFGIARTRWRLHDLRQVLPVVQHYTLPGLSLALRRLKIRRKRGRLAVTSPDPAYDRKLDWIDRAVAQARAHPDQVVTVYGDEYTLERQPKLGSVWTGPGPMPRVHLAAGRNFTYRYSGVLDVVRGRVLWDAALIMGVSNLRTFLRKLRRAYPTQTLVLIWDNWPVHQHPDVLQLAAEVGIQILWLPTYAPWTNPIEKLWRWLIEEVLRHHQRADHWTDLKQDVAAFLDRFAEGSDDLLRYVGLSPD